MVTASTLCRLFDTCILYSYKLFTCLSSAGIIILLWYTPVRVTTITYNPLALGLWDIYTISFFRRSHSGIRVLFHTDRLNYWIFYLSWFSLGSAACFIIIAFVLECFNVTREEPGMEFYRAGPHIEICVIKNHTKIKFTHNIIINVCISRYTTDELFFYFVNF